MPTQRFAAIALAAVTIALAAPAQTPLPRTADGKPDFEGIWQAAADLSISGEIPYQPWAAAKKAANFQNRAAADPVGKCYMPGVPRIMYMDFPFQIFQTPRAIAMAFEWSLDYRLVYMDGRPHFDGLDFWMGDSRGHWDGDTLVVDVTNHNDKTWLDAAGDFHSDALHVVERYRLTDANTIQYEATIEDPKVFTKPWTIQVALHRRKDRDRLMEYACEAEAEEANGAFTRDPKTWYPGNGKPVPPMLADSISPELANPPAAAANIRRTADGKPDLQGFYQAAASGANYGLEKHASDGLSPGGRGVVIDPADGKLPMQPWAVEELADRKKPERGYDDPTAHCFVAGVPRSMYVPSAFYIVQTPDYIVFLHERMAWRIVRLTGGAHVSHLPDSVRLWQGDSVGRWEGDTLVVDTANLNGKTWLNEAGEIVSYAEHVVERFTPTGPNSVRYQATVSDPVVYSRPWTIAFPLNRQNNDLIEVACHEEDRDLAHLKAVKDAAARKKQAP